jgi:cathepsin X
LGLQNLLNFKDRISGGGCNGGDSSRAYKFIHNYGISDDTCAPFMGVDFARGFTVADMYTKEDVQAHQCYLCAWDGNCLFVPRNHYDLYGADEYGQVIGIDAVKAEIFARGPVSCGLNSEPNEFNFYQGGVITCDNPKDTMCQTDIVDHVIVITGWGKDESTGMEYWIGRNSYGGQVRVGCCVCGCGYRCL